MREAMKPLVAWSIIALLFGLAACKKPSSPPASVEPQRFEVRGILRSIGFATREITVEHEEIPGYMPAMTMPFTVREMKEVEALKAGEAIGFQLVVTNKDSWVTGVKKIDASEVRLPAPGAKSASSGNVARLKERDTQARAVTRATFAGRPLVLTFIFTRCPLPNLK